jgi:hypothetical protein
MNGNKNHAFPAQRGFLSEMPGRLYFLEHVEGLTISVNSWLRAAAPPCTGRPEGLVTGNGSILDGETDRPYPVRS